MKRIALASREMYPLGGGGIGQYVAAAARVLATSTEVTVFTSMLYEPGYAQLRAAGDPRALPESVRVVFVPEPGTDEAWAWTHSMHCYSAWLYDRLLETFPDRGPDLIEFPDYLGEGFVTLQGARSLDPFLAQTTVCVRTHTASELCQVLDGCLPRDHATRTLHALERFTLKHADRLIWQGGDVLGTYQRFYGVASLAPAERIRYPYVGPTAAPGEDSEFTPGTPLKLLYVGRLERRKGVQNLIRAATGMARDDFRLTLIGADTHTAPLGVSMRDQLSLAIAEDFRIELLEPASREAVAAAIRDHDVVVLPSLWECWPYAALEALHLNRPVLGTPVGGLAEMIQPGVNGWIARGTDASALGDALEELLDRRAQLAAMVRRDQPLARARELSDEREIVDCYRALMPVRSPRAARKRPRRSEPPLVSAIVPYYQASEFVWDTVNSLLAQTYPRIEIVLVNDGSFEQDDWIVEEIAAGAPVILVSQMNAGLGAARNLGVVRSTGRYFFPLDADNVAHPEFVARCVEILEQRTDVAYVTSWSRYIAADGSPWDGVNIGYEPLGNESALNDQQNIAGDAAAVIRRRLFDAGFRYSEELTSYEDWALYRELQRAGHFGAIIPARLVDYRVRGDSLQTRFAGPHRERLLDEIEALQAERGMRWTSLSA